MEIQYIGEHLWPGYLGRFFIVMALLAVVMAAFSYWRGAVESRPDYRLWRSWGRKAFSLHSIFVLLVSVVFMYIILNRFYEYRYVWVHTENDLGLGYMIAAFWAGQEGSLLFWLLCQAVFGLLLIRFSRQWEAPVMSIIALSQIFMTATVLGWQIGPLGIGMNPFLLLRESAENAGNEFFQNPHYLHMIADGNGLNPLLRNFWMMSHPPFTFIGYAALLPPFAYAVAGFWTNRIHGWIAPALPWTILGVFFLGIGILLGGVWAYESLTFGGFWAWDPIENASLVPWLVLVAGLHLMLVSKNKKHSYAASFSAVVMAFVLVIYATYLTRSGVLAETSVHSFGNDGMGRQLLIYLFSMLALGGFWLIRRFGRLPEKEAEALLTREFWLFIGALVLVLSSFQIIFSTSIPVFNKLLGTSMSPPTEVVAYYNRWQLPFAVAVALLIGLTHFIQWGKNDSRRFIRHIAFSLGLSLLFTLIISLLIGFQSVAYILMLFAALFALFSSLDLLFRFRGMYARSGAILSHLGLALFLLAVLLTFANKETISKNTSGYFLGQQFPDHENLLLIRDEILPMGEFFVTYKGAEREGYYIHFQLDFLKTNADGDYYKVFSSYPSVQLNERMGNVYEPYARVSLTRDIFTYISFADVENAGMGSQRSHTGNYRMQPGDSIGLGNNFLVLRNIESDLSPGGGIDPDHIRIAANLAMVTHFGDTLALRPVFEVREGRIYHEEAVIRDMDLFIRFSEPADEPMTIVIDIFEETPDFIIVKTIIFPFINLLWFSILLTLAGLMVAFVQRWKRSFGKKQAID